MIHICRNPNFSNWIDIKIFDKLVDNALDYSKALEIAQKIKNQKPNKNLKITLKKS